MRLRDWCVSHVAACALPISGIRPCTSCRAETSATAVLPCASSVVSNTTRPSAGVLIACVISTSVQPKQGGQPEQGHDGQQIGRASCRERALKTHVLTTETRR